MWWLLVTLLFLFPRTTHAVEFSIKDPIVNNLEVTVTASLSASSNYYLQGTLRSQSSSKYFGETQNNKGEWIDYISSPEKEYIVSNFFATDIQNASWSGQVKLRFKTDDSNYLGPGLYDLKLRRYTGNSSSSAGDSNTITLILSSSLPSSTPSPNQSPSPSPSLLQSPAPPSPSLRQSLKPSPLPSPEPSIASPIGGEVSGVSTVSSESINISPSPFPTSLPRLALNQVRAKIVILSGLGLVAISMLCYFLYRRSSKHHIISE